MQLLHWILFCVLVITYLCDVFFGILPPVCRCDLWGYDLQFIRGRTSPPRHRVLSEEIGDCNACSLHVGCAQAGVHCDRWHHTPRTFCVYSKNKKTKMEEISVPLSYIHAEILPMHKASEFLSYISMFCCAFCFRCGVYRCHHGARRIFRRKTRSQKRFLCCRYRHAASKEYTARLAMATVNVLCKIATQSWETAGKYAFR